MGATPKGHARVTWYNVSNGSLWEGRNEYESFTGVIAGIRLRDSDYEGQRTTKLEIKMVDPDQPHIECAISGTLFYGGGMSAVTSWGRMVVARLVNPGNTGPGEIITLGVYGNNDPKKKSTFASLRKPGSDTALQGAAIPTMAVDAAECRRLVGLAVEKLISIYGPFNKADAAPHEAEPEADAIADEYGASPSDRDAPRHDDAPAGATPNFPPDDFPF